NEHESTMVSNTGRTSIDSSVSTANQFHDDAVFPYKRHRDANLTHSEKMQSESLLSAPLLERRKYMQNDYHASKSTTVPNSDTYHPNKPTPIPNSDVYRPNKDLIEALPEGRRSQPSEPLAPTLWLAFALSGIALLLGTIVL